MKDPAENARLTTAPTAALVWTRRNLMYNCLNNNTRCLCQTCAHRTDGKACGGRMCRECEAGTCEHDVWLCTGYRKEEEDA